MGLTKLSKKKLYSKGDPLILIDADIISHKLGHVHNNKHYKAQDGHTEKYRKDIDKYCKDNKLVKSNVEVCIDPSPIKEVLADVDEFIISVQDNCKSQNIQCFLTVGRTFRHNIATISGYKWKRQVANTKPVHLIAIKDHFISKYDANYKKGLEADDLIGMANGPNTIIASTDKDFDTLMSNRYNWDLLKLYRVTGHDAMVNFYSMCLLGDDADCIPGLTGVGFRSVHVKRLGKMLSQKEMFHHVRSLYRKHYRLYADQFLKEVCSLLYILRGKTDEAPPHWMSYYGMIEEDIYKEAIKEFL